MKSPQPDVSIPEVALAKPLGGAFLRLASHADDIGNNSRVPLLTFTRLHHVCIKT
jgi:hypothetical protein